MALLAIAIYHDKKLRKDLITRLKKQKAKSGAGRFRHDFVAMIMPRIDRGFFLGVVNLWTYNEINPFISYC